MKDKIIEMMVKYPSKFLTFVDKHPHATACLAFSAFAIVLIIFG